MILYDKSYELFSNYGMPLNSTDPAAVPRRTPPCPHDYPSVGGWKLNPRSLGNLEKGFSETNLGNNIPQPGKLGKEGVKV